MLIAGVDEAGRGPLAGPVVAAAVILDLPIEGVTDSKKLTAQKRMELATVIHNNAIDYAYGQCDVDEIDRLNIHKATLLAMKRAIEGLIRRPELILIDGIYCPETDIPCRAVVKGDLHEPAISAASILAKVKRDSEMVMLDLIYPEYGFAVHKGYSTPAHKKALETYGRSPIHRRSYQPVADAQKEYNPR